MLAQINESQKPEKPNKLAIALGLLEPVISIGSKFAGADKMASALKIQKPAGFALNTSNDYNNFTWGK